MTGEPLEGLLDQADASLLELVDQLLDKGCVITGELVLGLADVDLIYAELSVLLCGVDRLLDPRRDLQDPPEEE